MRLLATVLAMMPIAALAAESSARLTGTEWHLQRLRGERVAPWGTLKVGANGSITGRGGCNAIAGRASVSGDRVTFMGVIATMRPCASQPMTQFGPAYTAALGEAARWRVIDGRLHLIDKRGKDVLVFGPAGESVDGLPEDSPDGG